MFCIFVFDATTRYSSSHVQAWNGIRMKTFSEPNNACYFSCWLMKYDADVLILVFMRVMEQCSQGQCWIKSTTCPRRRTMVGKVVCMQHRPRGPINSLSYFGHVFTVQKTDWDQLKIDNQKRSSPSYFGIQCVKVNQVDHVYRACKYDCHVRWSYRVRIICTYIDNSRAC